MWPSGVEPPPVSRRSAGSPTSGRAPGSVVAVAGNPKRVVAARGWLGFAAKVAGGCGTGGASRRGCRSVRQNPPWNYSMRAGPESQVGWRSGGTGRQRRFQDHDRGILTGLNGKPNPRRSRRPCARAPCPRPRTVLTGTARHESQPHPAVTRGAPRPGHVGWPQPHARDGRGTGAASPRTTAGRLLVNARSRRPDSAAAHKADKKDLPTVVRCDGTVS
jgi:hypothetical protein